jgi:TetR/AcrR family transcriptional repressor of nem operon
VDPAAPDTASRILDTAERLAQTAGFNGFSYADIAREMKLTKASLHYHFGSKAALGKALMARYSSNFATALAAIEARDEDAPRRLRRYIELYASVLRRDRMCLCGMLAAEHDTLPRELRQDVAKFFAANEEWLTRLLLDGRRQGTIRITGSTRDAARLIVGSLEGAMLIARSSSNPSSFASIAQQLLSTLVAPAERPARTRATR